jgi:triacylglycerol lipase
MTVKKHTKKPQEPLANRKAKEFAFKSKIKGPIRELSPIRRALLFSEVSMISYLPIEECNIAAGRLGFVDGKFFNSNNAQAYWFQSEHDSVVVCRGTEVSELDDLKADANAVAAVAETVGKVHRGFKSEVDEIWPHIEKELEANTKPLWFCGHSLGGAMANICAGRCMLSYIKTEPEELFTYGSPRIGCRRYVNHVSLKHYRFVNNNDIVTRLPPPWLGYRHNGTEMYLDRSGQLKELLGWRRASDRLQGFLKGLLKFRIDHLSDHSVLQYIDTIFQLARHETAVPAKTEAKIPEPSPTETSAEATAQVTHDKTSVSGPAKRPDSKRVSV